MILLCLLSLPLFASEDAVISRLQACCCLRNESVAIEEAHTALQYYPQSSQIYRLAIRIFAKGGLDHEMTSLLKEYARLFPDDSLTHDDLEEISWGIIEKGAKG